MLIEVVDKAKDTSFIVRINDQYAKLVEDKLPFASRARVWKEEVYFETPMSIEQGVHSHRVSRGRVYFWKPGKAICLFYGISQIYTPGLEIGYVVDPASRLLTVEDGDEIEVRRHEVSTQYKDVVMQLANEGFDVGTPLDQGCRIVVARKVVGNVEVSLSIFIEEYGFHVESDALARYSNDLVNVKEFNRLRNLVEGVSRYARLDVSEEGFVVITACGDEKRALIEVVEDVARAFWLAKKHLAY
ncbi:MAG: hypothetical protein GXO32_02105 [Crenarchaeota archaeon]|nr:hypothetical protein [Thermoproteota archaeon]